MNFQRQRRKWKKVQTRRDSMVDIELEEGDVPTSSTSVVDADFCHEPNAKRKVKPVLRISYDEPG